MLIFDLSNILSYYGVPTFLSQNTMKNTRGSRRLGADSPRETPESIYVFILLIG